MALRTNIRLDRLSSQDVDLLEQVPEFLKQQAPPETRPASLEDTPTLSKPGAWWLAEITPTGPNGESDFSDARYWVQEILNLGPPGVDPAPDSNQTPDEIAVARFPLPQWWHYASYGDPFRSQRWLAAINLSESTFINASTGHGLTPGTLVQVYQHETRIGQVLYYFNAGAVAPTVTLRFTGSASGDALLCRTLGDNQQDVWIAKPWDLRKTPFDGQTWGNITYEFSRPSTFERIAIDMAGETELQVVIPQYLPGMHVMAQRQAAFQVGVSVGNVPVEWVDINMGGRAWARRG